MALALALPSAALAVPDFRASAKTIDRLSVAPGDTLEFTIRVINTSTPTTVTLRDALPPGVTYVPGTTTATGQIPPFPAITINVPDQNGTTGLAGAGFTLPLQVGIGGGLFPPVLREVDFKLKVTVDPNTFGLQICNAASIVSPDLSTPVLVKTNPCATVQSANLITPSLTVSVNGVDSVSAPHEAAPGDLLEYTLRLTNAGSIPATGATIHVDAPPFTKGLRVVARGDPNATLALQPAGGANGTGFFELTNVTVPGTFSLAVIWQVTALTAAEFVAAGVPAGQIDGKQLPEQALQSVGTTPAQLSDDPATSVSPDPTVVVMRYASADLSTSTKSVRDLTSGTSTFLAGDTVEYTVVLRNTGRLPGTGLALADLVPAPLTFVAGSATVTTGVVSFDGTSVRWAPADLAPNATATLAFRATIPSVVANGTSVTNVAKATSAEGATASPSVTFTVTSAPLFTTSTKTVVDVQGRPTTAVKPGDQLLYTLTVTNTGTAPATNVTVTDTLDANLGYDAGSASGGGAFSNGSVRWTLPGTLPPAPAAGSSVTLQFSAHLAPFIANGARIDNSALVSAAELLQAQRTQTATVIVASSGSLATSTKTFAIEAPGTPLPGRTVRYTLTLLATGDSTADDVVVTDAIAACLKSPVPAQGGTVAGGVVTWSKATTPALARITPGQPVTLTLDATIDPAAADGTVCDNLGALASSTVPAAQTSLARFTIVSKPELSKSTKAVAMLVDANGDGLYSPGDRVRYTIAVRNTGTFPASNVVLTDALPPQLVNVATTPAGSPGPGGALQWSLGALAAGAVATVLIDADVAPGTPNALSLCNQGQLTTPELAGPVPTVAPDPSAPGAPRTCVRVSSRPDLGGFTKKLEGGSPRHPGETLVYTLTLPNRGTAAASNVALADPIDPRFTFVAGTASDGGVARFDPVSSTFTVSWPSPLAPQATYTASLSLKLPATLDNGTQLPNQARVAVAELPGFVVSDDPATAAPRDATVVTIASAPDLSSATKTVAAAPGNPPHATPGVHPGDVVRYTISFANTGDADAKALVLTDPIDARLVPITPIPGGGVFANGKIVWTPTAPLKPGDPPLTFTFDALVQKPLANGTTIDNQATLTATGLAAPQLTDDPSLPGPHDPTRLTVVSAPDLSTSAKSFTNASRTDGSVHPGDTIVFTVQPTNTGDAETSATVVSDVLDPNLVFVSAAQGGTYDGAVRTVRWTLAKVGLDPIPPVTFTATIARPLADGTQVKNTALLSASELPAAGVRTNEVVLTVRSAPDLSSITKRALDASGAAITAPVAPGTIVTYSVRVPNTGDARANAVVITDAVDANLDTITPLDGGTLIGSSLRWTAATLDPGADTVVRFTARVVPLTADGTSIPNQAQVTSAELGAPQLSDDPATPAAKDATVVRVTSKPELSTSTKTVSVPGQTLPGLVRPGDTVRWVLTIVNTGDAYADDVVVRDAIDPLLGGVVAQPGGVLTAGVLTWTKAEVAQLARLAPGAANVVTLAFTAQVAASARDGDVIANQGQLDTREGLQFVTDDPSTPAAKDATRLTVRFADVRVDKTVKAVTPRADGTFHPGDLVDYALTVENRGSFPASDVAVADPLDPLLVDVAPGQGGVLTPAPGGPRLDWTGATTPALAQVVQGAKVVLGFRARIAPAARDGDVVSNQAKLTAPALNAPVPSDDPATPAAFDPTRLTVRATPDLRTSTKIVKNVTRADGTFRPGDTVEYTLHLANAGDAAASSVVARDAISPLLEAVSLGSQGTLSAGLVTWDQTTVPALAKVAPGAAVNLVFTARIVATAHDAQVVANQGQLTFDELGTSPAQVTDDPATPVAGDATTFVITAGARLGRSIKTVTNVTTAGGVVRPGDVLEYELHVVNDGGEPALNTYVTDPAPPRTRYVPGTTKLNGTSLGDLAGKSPLEQGLRVQSPRAGTTPGVVLPSTGAVPDDTVAIVSFRVQVAEDALAGTVISNQGQLRCDQVRQAATDDPATPEPGDSTDVVVGQASLLRAFKTWSLVDDRGTIGVVEVGDAIDYRFEIENRGSAEARAVTLGDELPSGAAPIPGTLSLDGVTLTDAVDTDAGEVTTTGGKSLLRVRLGTLAALGHHTITLRARVTDGPRLVNQAHLTAAGGLDLLSDGDPTLPGEQPTITPVGVAGPDLSTSVKAVYDLNGGDVLPGDELLFTITLVNSGPADLVDGVLDDPLPLGLEFVAGSAAGDGVITFVPSPAGGGTVRAGSLAVKAGGRAQVRFTARVGASVGLGSTLTNEAGVRIAPTLPRLALPPVSVVVGQAQGTASVTGKLLRDVDASGTATAPDRALGGFQVLVRRADALSGPPLRSVITSSQGAFRVPDLPRAAYRFEALSPEGVHFAQDDATFAAGAALTVEQTLLVQATGVLMRGDDRSALSGARLVLLYDDTEVGRAPPPCERDPSAIQLAAQALLGGRTLPRAVDVNCLAAGQQAQRTGSLGLYRFDLVDPSVALPAVPVQPRAYRLEVDPGTPLFTYPGKSPAPQAGLTGPGLVVPEGDPVDVRTPRWFRRFQLRPGEQVVNNHAVVDPSSLRLTKAATRPSATMGDVVGYVITLQNTTSQDLLTDSSGLGGVHLADALPDDFRYARNTARAQRVVTNGAGVVEHRCARLRGEARGAACLESLADPARTEATDKGPTAGRFLDFGPYDLRAGEALELRYQVIVGAAAKPGDHTNRAVARVGDVDASNADEAIVRVAQDPLFDLTSLIGKVYCERDADAFRARQEAGEDGVPGVRIHEDEGFVAETDWSGKFHFKGLQPGLHRFKLDPRSLPPGAQVLGDGAVTLYLTAGLDARANLPVTCHQVVAGPDRVVRKEVPPPPPPPPPPLLVELDRGALEVRLDGVPMKLPRASLAHVAAPGEELLLFADSAAPGAAVRFQTQLATGPSPEAWSLRVLDEAGVVLGALDGKGAPPAELAWVPSAPVLPGKTLRAQLEVSGPQGASAQRPLWLRVVPPQPEPAVVESFLLRGVLFNEQSATPTRELIRKLAPVIEKAKADPVLELRVEVHTGGEGAADAQLKLSEAQAQAVRELLAASGVPAERVKVRGRGSEVPLAVHAIDRGRQQNRRIEVKAVRLPPVPAPPQPLAFEETASLDGKPLPASARAELERGAKAGLLAQRKDGARARFEIGAEDRVLGEGPLALRLMPAQGELRAGGLVEALPLTRLGVRVIVDGAPGARVPLDGALPRALAFRLSAPVLEPRGWSFEVKNGEGAPAWATSGEGAPPQRLVWPDGKPLAPGLHAAQLSVRDGTGEGRSALATFEASPPPTPALRELLPAGGLFVGRARKLSADGLARMKKLAPRLLEAAGTEGQIVCEVFADDAADAGPLTEGRAAAIKQQLVSLGVIPARIEVRARGAATPVEPNATAPGRRANNRVVLSAFAAPKALPEFSAPAPVLVVSGVALKAEGEAFVGTLPAAPELLELDLALAHGASAKLSLRLRAPKPAPKAGPAAPAAGAAAPAAGPALPSAAGHPLEAPPLPGFEAPPLPGPTPPLAALPPSQGAAPAPGPAATASAAPADASAPVDAARLTVNLPPAGAVLRSESLFLKGQTLPTNTLTLNGAPVALDAQGRFALRVPLQRGGQTLSLVSKDPEGNTAFVERTLTVDPDGLFVLLLGEGAGGQGGAQLAGAGDRVDTGGFFLKGRASGVVEGRWDTSKRLGGLFSDVKLSGQFDTSRRDAPDAFRDLLDPARFYPIDGDSGLLTQQAVSRGPLFVNLQADQSRLLVGDFRTQLGGPGEQLFRFDRTLTGASLDFVKDGVTLFGREKALDSRLNGWVAQGDNRIRHGHAELRGTGGSVYWLRHADLVEGSERVRLVVRDANTGLELASLDRARFTDYTVRSGEGRLVFKQPVPSTADASAFTNANYTTALGGHPVFLVVDYEYRGAVGDGGGAGGVHVQETLFGAVTLGGGFLSENHAAGQSYLLGGLNAGFRPRPRTYATVELAQSQGSDAESYASNDGGMTFGSLGANCLDRSTDLYACLASGRAVRAEVGFELADWLGKPAAAGPGSPIPALQPPVAPGEALPLASLQLSPDLFRVHAYAEFNDRGFAANGTLLDQGSTKGGALVRWTPGDRTQVTGRFDQVGSDLATAFDAQAGYTTRRVTRRFLSLQAQQTLGAADTALGRWTLTGELSDATTEDLTLGSASTDQLLVGTLFRALPQLTLSLYQAFALAADATQVPTTGDRLTTTLGATWKFSELLSAQLTETVRWSGENATLLGLRTPLFGAGSLYANERFGLRAGQLQSTAIVGAEERVARGARAYGEYQLDNQASDASQRAVLGLMNRWEVRSGLFASVAYERVQVMGRTGLSVGGTSGGAPAGIAGAVDGGTLGGVNGQAPTAASGLNPGATCIPNTSPNVSAVPVSGPASTCSPATIGYNPVGGYFPGAVSRDSGSVSLELLGPERVKASGKLELRYDRADSRLVNVTPGVFDRLHFLFTGDASAKVSDDLSLFARTHYADSRVADLPDGSSRSEARWVELTAGLALRPIAADFIAILFKLTRLIDQRPIDLTSGASDEQSSDIVSLSPTFELPFGFAIAEKLAYKHVHSVLGGASEVDTHLWLWINRVDWHALKQLDLSGEFRVLALRSPSAGSDAIGGSGERGFLVEAAFKPTRFSRIGLGWNFTSFSDDELARADHTSGGLFVRAVGEF